MSVIMGKHGLYGRFRKQQYHDHRITAIMRAKWGIRFQIVMHRNTGTNEGK